MRCMIILGIVIIFNVFKNFIKEEEIYIKFFFKIICLVSDKVRFFFFRCSVFFIVYWYED